MMSKLRKFLKLVIILATIGGPLIVVLGLLNSVHPAFDLIANFRYHAAIGLFGLAGIWMITKHWRIGLSVALIGVYALSAASSGLPNLKVSTPRVKNNIHSLLSFNVRFDNPNRNGLIELINEHAPDIFVGIEMSFKWSDQLFRLEKIYKNKFHCPEWENVGGVYIFSKFPFTNAITYCHAYAALGTQQVMIESQAVTIGGVHLRWPWPASQPEQLQALKPALRSLDENTLIAGDFNAATWTYAIKSFAKDGDLQVVPNIGLTWLDARLPQFLTKWLGLPIDNVMQKGRVEILDAKTLPHAGSDHLPVLVRFSVTK